MFSLEQHEILEDMLLQCYLALMWLKRLRSNVNNCARRWIPLNTTPKCSDFNFPLGADRCKSRDDNSSRIPAFSHASIVFMHHTDWSLLAKTVRCGFREMGWRLCVTVLLFHFIGFFYVLKIVPLVPCSQGEGFGAPLGLHCVHWGPLEARPPSRKSSPLDSKCGGTLHHCQWTCAQRMNRSPSAVESDCDLQDESLDITCPPCLFLQLLPYSPLQTQLRTGSSPQGLLFAGSPGTWFYKWAN